MLFMKSMIKYIFALLLLMPLLAGCRIYSSYKRPDVQVSDSIFRQPVLSDDSTSMASISWKVLFTDSLLQGLIQRGLDNNTDVRVAYLKVQEAEATLTASKLAYLPSVSFTPDGAISSFNGAEPSMTYSLAASASWEIDLFGKLRNAQKGAKAALMQTQAYSQAVRTQLIATIANSYYSLLMLDEQLRVSEQTLENWSDYVNTLEMLKEYGTVDQVAIAQAKANKLNVEASVLTLKQQIQALENSLCALLGDVLGPVMRTSLGEQVFDAQISTGVPLQLLRNRPDVQQAEWALAQAFYATNEAYSAFYPSISLSGLAGWTNSGGGVIVNPGGWLLNAVASLVQPLFNRGTNMARLKISKAQQEEALLLFQQSILDAGVEVNDALSQWQTAQQRLVLDKQQIQSLRSALNDTELLMEYGTTNYLEVLIAQQNLLQAELTEVQDRFNEIQGVVNLYHALGGGIQ